MVVLGFDQAPRNCAWAMVDSDERRKIEWGQLDMLNYGDDDQRAMLEVRKQITPLIAKYQPAGIFFEQIVVNHKHIHMPTLYAQFSLATVIQFVAAEHNVPAYIAEIAVWRKRFLGRANAPKSEHIIGTSRDWLKGAAIIECARRNILVGSDHEAEAIGIAEYGLAQLCPAYRKRTKGETERRQLEARRLEMQK